MRKTVVFAARLPDTYLYEPIYPPERQAEIEKCSNEKVKREKYFVWKLLEYAIFNTIGEPIENFNFEKNPNRKWVSDRVYFSLSHSDGVVAVALSDREVGVDIERIHPHREGLEKHILTERELSLIDTADPWEYIIRLWTQKESIFKASDGKLFEPTRIETAEYSVKTEMLEFDGEKFMLSVCAHDVDRTSFEIYRF